MHYDNHFFIETFLENKKKKKTVSYKKKQHNTP